jgi:hypothetical protein
MAVLICQSRRREVADTPEEQVRQKLLAWLHHDRGIPWGALEAEVPLARFSAGASGRADVVAFRPGSTSGGPALDAVLVAECKAPGELEAVGARAQAVRYLQVLPAPWLLLTDGKLLLIWHREGDGSWQETAQLPRWETL